MHSAVTEGKMSFALFVQTLARDEDRAIVLGQVAGLRKVPPRFTSADLNDLCDVLRVPRFSNLPTTLKRALAHDLVRNYGRGTWALTPAGDEHVRALLADIDQIEMELALVESPSSEFARARHTLIPPSFAPPRWSTGISRLNQRFPFESNVFCMTRFPGDSPDDPLPIVLDSMRTIFANRGMNLHVASDGQFEDDLLGNVGAYLWASRYGIGILENRVGKGLNYNVVLEIGAMIVTGRRCALLKDVSIPNLPTDLAGQIYKPVDLDDLDSVTHAVEDWIERDLAAPASLPEN